MNQIPTKEKPCKDCNDTGFYGDNGPGIKGNSEYVPCDCDPTKRARRRLGKDETDTK